jgi:hypothetical protein
MKTRRHSTTIMIVTVIACWFVAEVAASQEKHAPLRREVLHPSGTPVSTMININNVAAWYSANGEQERIPTTGYSGLWYPRGTGTAVYTAGLIWGGRFKDGTSPSLRVNGQSYSKGTKAGSIIGLRTGAAEDPYDPNVRVWRIRRDYATADLRKDAAEVLNNGQLVTVTEVQIQQTRDQYAKDWAEWPWQKGAPFYDTGYVDYFGTTRNGAGNGILDRGEDLNSNGILDPAEDANSNGVLDGETPGIADADQVLWFSCNDIGVMEPWLCPESGMEEQVTIWAFNRIDPLGHSLFKRFRLIYKGTATTPYGATIDSMYLMHWADPDIGESGDDFAGCDTTLNLAYCFNAFPVDALYAIFNISAPPAGGYVLLQGPRAPGTPTDTAIWNMQKMRGYRNLPMTAANYFAAGGRYADPPFNYTGAIEWYQLLRGLPPQPVGGGPGINDPPMVVNPVTGSPTQFWLTGDPVFQTGWIDGILEAPGDRRICLSSGPFTMALGDTQEIVTAWVGGLGSSNLSSVGVMKSNAIVVRQAFLSSLPFVDSAPGEEAGPHVPRDLALLQNYPNPFNPATTIGYTVGGVRLQASGFRDVRLVVYDLLGREVAVLVSEKKAPGGYEVAFDASGLASGVYFYRLVSGAYVESRKMVLMK